MEKSGSEMFVFPYSTPQGFSNLKMSSDGTSLTGIWFEPDDRKMGEICGKTRNLKVFDETCRWLDIYFSGVQPDFIPEFVLENVTPFRREIIDILMKIPFGSSVTYGEIADIYAKRHKIVKMSAQAVGGAVGWNPVCILIPCHRVLGSNRKIVGYRGGLGNKEALLTHEKIDYIK